MKGEKEAKVKQESVEVHAPEGWQLNLLALNFTMDGAGVMSVLDACLMSARLFLLQQFLLWKPGSLLAKLNFAICGLGKYSLILQIFPAHSFLVATGLPEAGFQLYWMYGKLMTTLVSVQWRSSLSSSPARRIQLRRTGSSMRLQFLVITAVCGKQVASEADCLCLQPPICQTLVAPR